MSSAANEDLLEDMTRPERLVLKRAWAKTARTPLFSQGPAMAKAIEKVRRRGLIEAAGLGFVLTREGFRLAQRLRAEGWPNCEKRTR